MKLSTKKIIAKEFLLIISILLVTLIFNISIYPYNYFLERNILSEDQNILDLRQKANGVLLNYNKKKENHDMFYRLLLVEYDLNESSTKIWTDLTRLYYTDSIPIKFNNTWEKKLIRLLNNEGFKNGKEFEDFVHENIFTEKDSLDFRYAQSLNDSINLLTNKISGYYNKMIYKSRHREYTLYFLLILILIAYPVRFLFIGIKWSINTIKQNN